MQIHQTNEPSTADQASREVHTIDMWFSRRRGLWIVERLDADGHLLGSAHCAEDEAGAAACLEEWLRTHGDHQWLAPRVERQVHDGVRSPVKQRRRAA